MRVPGSDPIRVYVIDDHPVVSVGVGLALADEPDLLLVGDAGTAADGLAGAIAARPDVVLVDLCLPDRSGTDLLADLRAALPASAKVVVLSAYDDEFRVAEALGAGAQGYLLKSCSMGELTAGLRAAAAGGTPLSPSLTEGVLRTMRRNGRSSGTIEALTARELQVMERFATGLSTREVAASLGISPKTVETHRIRIYEKLGARSVIDLTRIAVRTGLVRA